MQPRQLPAALARFFARQRLWLVGLVLLIAMATLLTAARAALSYVSASETYDPDLTNSLSIARPSGVSAGDLLLAGVTQPESNTINTPSGWTLVATSQLNSTSNPNLRVFYKVAGGSEPGSYTFTSAGSESMAIGIAVFRGIDTSNPIAASAVQANNTASTSGVAPAVTPGVTQAMLVSFWGTHDNGGDEPVLTVPAGMTRVVGSTMMGGNTAETRLTMAYQALSAATSTGTRTASLGSSWRTNTASVALRPLGPASITGTVFEDKNYGGGAGRNLATANGNGGGLVNGATVELYGSGGAFIASTTTASNGTYSFSGLASSTSYFVRVASTTVGTTRACNTGCGGTQAVMTFRTAAPSGSAVAVTDWVGGTNPAVADAGTAGSSAVFNTSTYVFSAGLSGTAHAVAPVTTGSAATSGVDFGFSFNVVSNNNNSGQGSLRQLIVNTNEIIATGLAISGGVAELDNAIFMISNGTAAAGLRASNNYFSGGVTTINLTSAFPIVIGSVIDARNQPGWAGSPVVVINGTSAGASTDGFQLNGQNTVGGVTLAGFTIRNFPRYGVNAYGNGNTIQGNWIGLSSAGTAAAANGSDGILVGAGSSGDVVGGTGSNDGNVTSGNSGSGIRVQGSNTVIQGNVSGLNAAGTAAVSNGGDGLTLDNANNATVGGTSAGARNVFSGNSGPTADGIWIDLGSDHTVRGNYIGLNTAGTATVANGYAGIAVDGASNNTIGGTGAGEANVIAGNGGNGVEISPRQSGCCSTTSANGNRISANSIYSNGGLGIDLNGDGVTTNNGSKSSSVGNQGMDFPVITTATITGTTMTLAGYVGSAANQSTFANAVVEFFIADTTAAGNGEGRTYIGTLTANGSGNFSGTLSGVAGITGGTTRITATARDGSNDTSEFSANVVVTRLVIISGTVFEDPNYGGGAGRNRTAASGSGVNAARVELYNSASTYVTATTTAANGSYSFSGQTAGVYYVRVVNSTVQSARSGSTGSLVPVMTHRTESSAGTATDITNEVGGLSPGKTDTAAGTGGTTLWTSCAAENATCSFTGTRVVRYGGTNAAGTASNWAILVLTGGTPCTNAVFGDPISGTVKACSLLSADYQSVSTVNASGNDVAGVDFGFNFDTIVNTNDLGQGSLRQAVTNANTLTGDTGLAQAGRTAGIENLVFMISNGSAGNGLRSSNNFFSGGVATIAPASPLPTLTTPMVVDAQAQPGWTSDPVVHVNGAPAGGNAFLLTGGATVMRGLGVRGAGTGIRISGSSGNTIEGCWVGTTAAGTAAAANSQGIWIDSSSSNVVGGSTSAKRNVLSGNTSNGLVLNNAVGTVVKGNYFGLNATGTAAVANGDSGIVLIGSSTGTVIGGTAAGEGNVIAGNSGAAGGASGGISIQSPGSTGSVIRGNVIGLRADLSATIPSTGFGIHVAAANTTIGGTAAGAGNRITAHSLDGVGVTGTSTTGVSIQGNGIYGNSGIGIDLADNGATANDGAKTASQPNLLMDYPVFTAAAINGTTLTVSGYVGSAAGQTAFANARVEIFASDGTNANGQGRTYLGFVTADANGNFTAQNLTVSGLVSGDLITATATDGSGNTSEFGPNIAAAALGISGTVFEDLNYGGGAGRNKAAALAGGGSARPGARVELAQISGSTATVVAVTTTDASGNYSFTGLTPASYLLRVLSSTVTSARGGYVGTLMAVSTYHANSSGGAAVDVTNEVGGRAPAFTTYSASAANVGASSPTSVDYSDGVANVTLNSGAVAGIDFGYSFNVVSNLNNTGQGSLRQAITNANALLGDGGLAQSGLTAGYDNLVFMISNGSSAAGLRSANNFFSGGVATIAPTSALPPVTAPLVIDAQKQPGWVLAPLVELNGAGAGGGVNGLVLNASGTQVRGLVINRFNHQGITSTSGDGLVLQGNYIGTNAAGSAAAANGQSAIFINNLSGNNHQIGGTSAAQRNVLSGGNGFDGIAITGGSGHVIQGNFIGVNAAGTALLGNTRDGVRLRDAVTGATVGGTAAGAANTIAGNGGAGVTVTAGSTGVFITGNNIYANSGPGIDLNADGASPNDGAKPANTANLMMDAPVFTAASISGTTLTVAGYVGSAAGQGTFAASRVEIFISDASNPAGQGQTYLGFGTTDASGNFSATLVGVAGVTDGVTRLTATATDASNNTSEFGPNLLVGMKLSGTVFEDVNYGGGAGRSLAGSGGVGLAGVTVELYSASGAYLSSTTTAAGGSYTFNGVGNGNFFVRVASTTVASQRSGTWAGLRSVMTYRTTATSGTAVAVTDWVGGTNPALVDAGLATAGTVLNTSSYVFSAVLSGTAHAVAPVTTNNAAVAGLDFGFNFDTVVNTNNSGQGSLREAIGSANTLGGDASLAQAGRTAGVENIVFMISNGSAGNGLRSTLNYFSGGVASIAPTTAMPTVSTPLVLDAQTQPGWIANPVIELRGDGAGSVTGLTFNAGNSTLRGFIVNRFGSGGVSITTNGVYTLQGNWLGLDASGTTAAANGGHGLSLTSSGSGFQIGGTSAAQRNVISGNQNYGVYIGNGTGHVLQGNYIGTNALGTAAVANTSVGIGFMGANSAGTVGGTAAGAGNVISGNTSYGVWLQGSPATVQGNFIGTNAAGTAAIANAYGMFIYSAGHQIGGGSAAARNVVSGNTLRGIWLDAAGNTVQGNHVGTNAAGTAAVPNGTDGIYAKGNNNVIGGTGGGVGNLVSGNGSAGVLVWTGFTGNSILGNSIHGNGALGIDLASLGVSANDGAKTAGAANLLMDSPVFTAARATGNQLTVAGYIGTVAGQTVFAGARVEVFLSDDDASGFGEGKTWLGALTADGSGNFSGTLTMPVAGLPLGSKLTATATDGSNNTSEFGANFAGLIVDLVVNDNGDAVDSNPGDGSCNTAGGVCTLRAAIAELNAWPTLPGPPAITFAIPGCSVYGSAACRISPATALPSVSRSVLIDGTTQAGFNTGSYAPIIEIDGSATSAGTAGLVIAGNNSTVRGLAINRFASHGITLSGSGGTLVGLRLGLSAGAATAAPNGGAGAYITGANATIGGITAADRNAIAGNTGSGIVVAASGAVISSNFIGTDSAGTAGLGNGGSGVFTMAGSLTGVSLSGNSIVNNAGNGVTVAGGAAQVQVLGNSIAGNGSLGIDLGNDGVTVNTGTTDSSKPNNGINQPVITGAGVGANSLTVYGHVGTGAGQALFANSRVEFFKAAPDASGYGEGQVYLGFLTTDANGRYSGSFSFPPGAIDAGDALTATATDGAGNTSEFSANWTTTTVAALTPGSFNAFDTDAAANALSGVIRSRVAGAAANIAVIALDNNGTALHPGFTGIVTLTWVDARNDSGAATGSCRSTWVDAGVAGVAAFSNNNRVTASVTPPASATRVMRLKMSYTSGGGGTVTACSNDAFAALPASYNWLGASDTDSATAGTARTLANTSASGGNVHRAGRPFTVRAQALDATGALMTGYDGTPVLATAGCLLPGGCSAGTLTAANTAAVAGAYTHNAVSYAEVGAIQLRLTDSNYADVDTADTAVGVRTLTSSTLSVGRFVPDSLSVTLSTNGQFATGNGACMAGGSGNTFVGQGYGWSTAPQLTVTARNAAGTTTAFWTGSLMKLTPAMVAEALAASNTGSATLSSSFGAVSVSDLGSGLARVTASSTDRFVLELPPGSVQDSATPSFTYSATVTDNSEAGVSGNPTLTGNISQSNVPFNSGAVFHSGRLTLSPGYGDTRAGVRLMAQLQRYTAAGWVTMTEDQGCVTINTNNVGVEAPVGVFTTAGVCAAPLQAAVTTRGGRAWLSLPATPGGAPGRLTLRLAGGGATGNSCTPAGASAALVGMGLPWLMGGTSAAGPAAFATWGSPQRDAVLRRETW